MSGARGASIKRVYGWRSRIAVCLACVVYLALLLSSAWADGGHIALHRTQGAYTVTMFTAPNPLVSGRGDLSVLVEDGETAAPVADATAEARLVDAGGPPQVVQLTHAGSSNPLLLAGSPVFATPASYRVELTVSRPGAASSVFYAVLVVEPDHRRRNTLLFALLLPMGIVVLFLLNQHAKRLGSQRRVGAR